jgi:putative ABC transport system substrate-binding protein
VTILVSPTNPPTPAILQEVQRAARTLTITALALKSRLLAMYPDHMYVDAGGLIPYGLNLVDAYRRAATYVDRLLKGVKPADLPVERSMKLKLVINLKTAQALGLTSPPTLLFQTVEVIR